MQRIMNDPDSIVDEMLEGFLKSHGNLVKRTENPRAVRTVCSTDGRVAVVTGGGSGHKPAFVGYCGEGLCDAAAVGEICTSPTAKAFLDAFAAVDSGRGVACLYGNYSGDNMNVKMAVKMAKKLGITVKTVIANDDVASAPKTEREKRRGVAGEILMWKCGGAAAATGADLDEVIRIAQKAIDSTRSVGIGLSPCTLPAVGHPNFVIEAGTMEVGIGHHGEPGIAVCPLESAGSIAKRMCDIVLLKDAGHRVTLEATGDARSVTVEFPGMDYLGLWHMPKTDASYVCIEPWCSLPSSKGKIAAFEEQTDLITLHPNKIYRNTWSITISI